MRWAVVLLALLVLLACSAVGFQPAECSSLSPDSSGWLNDRLYRDLMRGTYAGDCFKFTGVVAQSVEGGYVVDTEGYGTGFPGDVFVRWEGDYQFVQGDLVLVTGAVVEPLTFETVLGAQRTIPAFYGSEIVDVQQRSRELTATRQILAATKQIEYSADYEKRTTAALEEVQLSCQDSSNIAAKIENTYAYYDDKVIDLKLNFSIGPVPDDIDADTVPNILLKGTFAAQTVEGEYAKYGFIKDGKVTAVWTGEDCEFKDIQTEHSSIRTPDPNVPKPTRDPDAPTFTPRPKPTKEMRK